MFGTSLYEEQGLESVNLFLNQFLIQLAGERKKRHLRFVQRKENHAGKFERKIMV